MPHTLCVVGIEVSGRLVREDEASATGSDGHERRGHLHTSQLATREFVGSARSEPGEVDVVECRGDEIIGGLRRPAYVVGDGGSEGGQALPDDSQLVGPRFRIEVA